jgi:GT2 family glycosyltransferase
MNEVNLPKVYIILVNYNGWKDTIECLESVYRINYCNYQVIVVDNNSNDDSLLHIKEWAKGNLNVYSGANNNLQPFTFPPITKPVTFDEYVYNKSFFKPTSPDSNNSLILIQSTENKGFAAGNNIAISFAFKQGDFKYAWLLNNDTVIKKDSLTVLVEKAEAKESYGKKIGIIASKLLYYSNPDTIQAVGGKFNKWFAVGGHIGAFHKDDGSYDQEEIKLDYAVGASMLVSKRFIEEVGYMCEDYFLYYEEMDWSERGRKIGFETIYCYKSTVFHKEGASIGSGHTKLKSELSDIYSIKNRFKFTRKFFPGYLPTVYAGLALVVINRLRRKQFSRVFQILKAVYNEVA